MITYSIIHKSQLEGARRLDAEYFQPEYLTIEKTLLASGMNKLWKDIDGKFMTGPFGSEFNVENYVVDGKYRYVRGKDVNEFFLADDDNVYMPEKDYSRMKKYALKEGDILVSVVGTLGNVAIVDGFVPPAIYSCKSTAFRTNAINTYYLLAYLNSKYGRNLLERSVRGSLQAGLNIDDLKSLPVYIPSLKDQEKVASIIFEAKKSIIDSKSLYSQAENLLLEELGLKDYRLDEALSYVINLSDAQTANRVDAEYFQPRFAMIKKKIKMHALLGAIASVKKGIEPGANAYQDQGKLFIRVSSLSKDGLEGKDQKYLSPELYQKLKKEYEPKLGEILLTKDASPGIAFVLKKQVEGIISGGILRLKLKEEIESEYVALCINSIVGQSQIVRDAGGSIITHWKPEQVKNMWIPILPKRTQKKIADLVRRSHEARKKSKELLDEAKNKVEDMIEKGL